jgi:hypothetical protein
VRLQFEEIEPKMFSKGEFSALSPAEQAEALEVRSGFSVKVKGWIEGLGLRV